MLIAHSEGQLHLLGLMVGGWLFGASLEVRRYLTPAILMVDVLGLKLPWLHFSVMEVLYFFYYCVIFRESLGRSQILLNKP